MVSIRSTGLKLYVHISKFSLNDLELPDLLVELLSFVDISKSDIESVLHYANWTSREEKSFIIETLHENVDSRVDLAENILSWDLAIFKDQLSSF